MAITANAGSTSKIGNSLFDNNKLSIYYNSGVYSTSFIYNTKFDFSNLPPFAFNSIPYHPLAVNSSNVLVGTDYVPTPTSKNIFTHASIGIYNSNSDLTVCNSKFIQIGFNEIEQQGVIARYGDGIVATAVTGVAKTIVIGSKTIGLITQPGCEFIDISNGINVNSNYITEVKSNKFDLCPC